MDFISDEQKVLYLVCIETSLFHIYTQLFSQGLIEVFTQLMPNVEYKYCVKHLYENYKKII